MKDLRADWRKWTWSEKLVAVFLAMGLSGMAPSLILLDQASSPAASFLRHSITASCSGGC